MRRGAVSGDHLVVKYLPPPLPKPLDVADVLVGVRLHAIKIPPP